MGLFQNPFFQSKDEKVEGFYTNGNLALQCNQYDLANSNFRKAAEGGHVSAFYNLALLNGCGYISPYDLDLAIDYFYKAASAGHPTASEKLQLLEAADRGGFGSHNLAKFASETIPLQDGLNHLVMMCAGRFFDVLCKKYGATNDVIAYELDAAATSENPAVLRYLSRTGIPSSFYEGGLNRLTPGSVADQITSGLNELHVGMKKSGMADEMCLMARCTIAGHIIRKSPYGSHSQPLKGVYDFYR
jgi:TPR repeat protein